MQRGRLHDQSYEIEHKTVSSSTGDMMSRLTDTESAVWGEACDGHHVDNLLARVSNTVQSTAHSANNNLFEPRFGMKKTQT